MACWEPVSTWVWVEERSWLWSRITCRALCKYRLSDLTPDLLNLNVQVCSPGKRLFLRPSPSTHPPYTHTYTQHVQAHIHTHTDIYTQTYMDTYT